MLHTTFRLMSGLQPRGLDYRELARHLGEGRTYGQDTPIPLDKVLDVVGLEAALWCLSRTVEDCSGMDRLLAADYAERVLRYFEDVFPEDDHPREAIEIARKFARGEISNDVRHLIFCSTSDAALAAVRESSEAAAAFAALFCAEGGNPVALTAHYQASTAVRRAKGSEAAAAEERWQEARLRGYLEGGASDGQTPNG